MPRPETTLAESVCLALVVSGADYGGAVAELLAPGAELGHIWTLSRPLTYRAIDALIARGLVDRSGVAPGRGGDRRLLEPTRRGRSVTRQWLSEPVSHLRDVRTELLLKFRILERMDESLVPLAEAQRALFRPMVDALIDGSTDDVVSRWRRHHARAVLGFLDGVIEDAT